MNQPDLMAYAYARLRATDEARSAALAHDPRVRTPDPDESEDADVRRCLICGAEVGGRVLMCTACHEAGWCTIPCKGCGGKLRDLERRHRNPSRRGFCRACRAEMPQVHRGGNSRPLTEAA